MVVEPPLIKQLFLAQKNCKARGPEADFKGDPVSDLELSLYVFRKKPERPPGSGKRKLLCEHRFQGYFEAAEDIYRGGFACIVKTAKDLIPLKPVGVKNF
jgi:hypothetical protein